MAPKKTILGYDEVQYEHKIMLSFASVIVKMFLMAIASGQIFCNDPNPITLGSCENLDWVAISVGWVGILGIAFMFCVVNFKAFNPIFSKVMKIDFLVTAMIFSVAYVNPTIIADKIMIWLIGIWFFAFLLTPFNRSKSHWNKIMEYGSLVSLSIMLLIHFIPDIPTVLDSLSTGIVITSFLSIFGAGSEK